ncbi:eight-cysteine-cluster domain-containing protein [Candidatus Woesearchaeota archaeon]|nr:eight-cysteine-cluster domain-containing protein [Candidatus Woesearchaeota archaeon]
MKKGLFIISIAVFLLLIIGCAPSGAPGRVTTPAPRELESMDSCTVNDDCVCGGVDTYSGRCFLGNTDYQAKYVDTSKDCPDFCTGIAGNLVVKCIDSRCIQMMECLSDSDCESGKCTGNRCVGSAPAECSSDSDCTKGGCSGELCRPKSAEPVATICVYNPEYDCLSMVECGCTDGKCDWSTSPEYERCVSEKERGPRIVP